VLSMSTTAGVQKLAALALARAGGVSNASTTAEDLTKNNPDNTFPNYYWLQVTAATIELQHNDFTKAIERLQSASPYELGYSQPFS
jgi:predicted Zn-dependent protease